MQRTPLPAIRSSIALKPGARNEHHAPDADPLDMAKRPGGEDWLAGRSS
jgi:hypothetical protein